MRICDLTTPIGRLARASKYLRESWSNASTHWSDHTAAHFEETHVTPLLTSITQAASAMERFQEILRQAEKACSEEYES